ncbi:nitronate monooxygenase [Mycobacterium sp. CBMA293]|uniref:NAD(P)H-dependent flavin oxidoreductase n=1 Tax=unclassified Mycolicibacterium TaxID=2636767 RepID=UPI0012DBD5F4|nr:MULTISPECIES: nitronate monooxygenase family protein [unclassified Mycolicibacterium]MUL49470.1 nitronate monooxygenase [Mycolicibacterium sp. CBMA 360]MUL57251.1 nitronate monooxygenase [Mycolicibacterium sp. CBMA 335]MUL70291.1 nitronate monooxygenase [Mycolicibacterium sp. CBMA 311]MUL92339.1 nitronate monooxygenase [Mycolicibacterium sp. CBMA 230]MUM06760.1 nitronate monooxygenase [Mycolicibacterium sp. CBMA 213]
MLKTRFTEVFGIEHPIVQGGMMWVGRADLVSAVANAGALGFLTALSQPTPDALMHEIERCRSMTQQPFGVNLTMLPSVNPPPYADYCQAIIDSGITIVETAGSRARDVITTLKDRGIRVIHKCTSVRHALSAQQLGVDAVSIDGFECAGHPGEDDVPGLILIPRAVDTLTVPVIASGGFADGRGLVAALSLGAQGINMGTRFCATREAPIHENVKNAIVANTELDTNLIFRSFHNTARVGKNSVSDEVVEISSRPGATFDDVAHLVKGTMGRHLLETGDMSSGLFWTGQSQGLIRDIPSVSDLVLRIVADATEIISRHLAATVVAPHQIATTDRQFAQQTNGAER